MELSKIVQTPKTTIQLKKNEIADQKAYNLEQFDGRARRLNITSIVKIIIQQGPTWAY